MKITEFDIKIDKNKVLELIDCYQDSPVYEAVLEEFEEILPTAYETLSPATALEFAEDSLYCLMTVGKEITLLADKFFDEGSSLKAMLTNALADACLFQMDTLLQEVIIRLCKERKVGVIKRLEAPRDISLEEQKKAWEITKAEEQLGIHMKESYMLDPIKSSCQIYLLQKDCEEYAVEHTCENCPKTDCKMRSEQYFSVTVKQGEKQTVIKGKKGQTLLEMLRDAGIYVNAVCGGNGTCGKCKVEVAGEGECLACKTVPDKSCTIVLPEGENHFSVVTEYNAEQGVEKGAGITAPGKEQRYGIAADIGTTTIAMQLIDLTNGEALDTYTSINSQKAYGADVISRIKASNEGKKEILQKCIKEDLQKGIKRLLAGREKKIEHMVISGNTTMIHLLMGYSCETLGVYPFTPVNLKRIETSCQELLSPGVQDFPITIFPGISAYVGGDIVAGLYACGFHTAEKVNVLIDLGTNGEMAIGNKDRIVVASAAAGPAFEGGNIICGTGSVPGAVCKADYDGESFRVETIRGEVPSGICGTGVVDITYELLKNGLVDKTGLLDEKYFKNGMVIAENADKVLRFYQKDIREIQLAKSAIRAGLETLISKFGITREEIESIYIAGGFGYKIDIRKAAGIGLLPEDCVGKMQAVGNSSLRGCIMALTDENARRDMEKIASISEETELSLSDEFNEYYMKYMYF